MKNRVYAKRIGSVLLVATLVAGLVGGVTGTYSTKVQAEEATKQESTALAQDKEKVENFATEKLGSLVAGKDGTGKEETVYIFTKEDGSTDHILVNAKLNNTDGAKEIVDESDLTDIVNLSGDETYTQNGDRLVWAANGESITYQGTSTKEAPVGVKITYYLDGKEISATDLAGKSGHVKIRFDYTNHETRTITVNGTESEAYVPFTVVTAMLLPSSNFSNVQVENGESSKLSTGTMVMGVALPGLQDSLEKGLAGTDYSLDITFPEFVEVEADTVDCQVDLILSVASSNLVNVSALDDISTEDVEEKLNSLIEGVDELTEGTTQLVDGSKKLADGTGDLEKGAKSLSEGTDQLAEGAQSLASGAATLLTGVGSLKDGSSQVANGAATLAEGAGTLASGAAQVSAGVNTMVGSVAAMPGQIQASEQALYAQANASLGALGLSVDYESDHAGMNTASIDTAIAIVSGYIAQTGGDSSAVAALYQVKGAVSALQSVEMSLGAVDASQLVALSQGAEAVAKGAEELSGGANRLASGASSLDDGVTTLQGGVGTLKDGAANLSDGAAAVNEGAEKLYSGSTQLHDGANKLYDGMVTMDGGVSEFSEQGLSELGKFTDGSASNLLGRIKAVLNLGSEYNTFAGKNEDMEGSVVFIYRMPGIN